MQLYKVNQSNMWGMYLLCGLQIKLYTAKYLCICNSDCYAAIWVRNLYFSKYLNRIPISECVCDITVCAICLFATWKVFATGWNLHLTLHATYKINSLYCVVCVMHFYTVLCFIYRYYYSIYQFIIPSWRKSWTSTTYIMFESYNRLLFYPFYMGELQRFDCRK